MMLLPSRSLRKGSSPLLLLALAVSLGIQGGLSLAAEPWYIKSPVIVTAPMDVGDIVIGDGGSLSVKNVPDPGFRISGNLIVTENGIAEFTGSVIQVLSTYHGEYSLIVIGSGILRIQNCDYRIPNSVQHALIAWEKGQVEVIDSNFTFAQLIASGEAKLTASRLNGQFECILQEKGRLDLADIPRNAGSGGLWVWPSFMPGSRVVYSPPLPGFITDYSFPPGDAFGIEQSFSITRCNVVLWPMLVREGTTLTLKDISEENKVIVGLHLPSSATISGLLNGLTYADVVLELRDRNLRLVNASIDTWNLYPEKRAKVTVKESLIGELLAFGKSKVTMQNTKVDGSGGYLGVTDKARIQAIDCVVTCDVQATKKASAVFLRSTILPYPWDTSAAFTRFGAHDDARIQIDQTTVASIPALGGSGAIALTWIIAPSNSPPSEGESVEVLGSAAIYSLDPSAGLASWRLRAHRVKSPSYRLLGSGTVNAENTTLGIWQDAKPHYPYELVLSGKGKSGWTFSSKVPVPAKSE